MVDDIITRIGLNSFYKNTKDTDLEKIYSNIYKPSNNKNVFFLCNMGIGDMIVTTGIIEFLTTIYDTVTVVCRNEYVKYLYSFHNNNDKIKILIYNDKYSDVVKWSFSNKLLNEIGKIMDIYAIGHHSKTKILSIYPNSYYDQCGLPLSFMKDYVHINIPKNIRDIYTELFEKYLKYIVVHQQGSTCNLDLVNKYNININDILTIDVNRNLYDKNHEFHTISNKFVDLENPMWYSLLLENAHEIYVVDSCIHAFTYLLDLSRVSKKVCVIREYGFKYAGHGFENVQLKLSYHGMGMYEYTFPDNM